VRPHGNEPRLRWSTLAERGGQRLRATRPWSPRQGAASVAVLAIHATIITVAILATRSRDSQTSVRDFVSTWILTPTAPAPKTPNPQSLPPAPSFTIDPIQIEPPKMESVPMPPAGTSGAIDWTMEAERAAAAISAGPKGRQFGSRPGSGFQEEQPHPPPAHQPGEGYRDEFGNSVVWVNDRCYAVSEPGTFGTPDFLSRARPTYTVCIDRSAPEGELFKDLPAYKKRHPQQ
jgi:hypothetical protein